MQAGIIGARPSIGARGRAHAGRLIAAITAAILGAVLVWGVGFSPIAALHNAAHDARHSMAFPCH